MKKGIILFAALIFVFSIQHTKCDEKNMFVFADVSEGDWYYTAVTQLARNGIIPDSNMFEGESFSKRAEIAQWLYNLDKCIGGKLSAKKAQSFSDTDENSPYSEAISWAAGNGIINGFEDGSFRPDDICEREQMCTMAIRYFNLCKIRPSDLFGAEQFADSLEVSDFARSYVAAAKMSGLVGGDENGFFNPHASITKAECASVIYTMMNIAVTPSGEGSTPVETGADSYTYLYDGYKTVSQYLFNPYVTESDPVDLSYFDNAVMVGDSVTMSLQFYCAASGALGNVKFLCAGSLSPANALWEVSSESVHPSVNGVKMKLEDAVPVVGADKIYVMLGVNSIAMGVDKCINDLKTVLGNIKAKSPNVKFIIQSVTPMTSDSPIRTDRLNNGKIIEYNEKLLELCRENGWYYLNVAECMRDSYGALKKEYCSDPAVMGIHFTMAADKVWTDYLKTHVPAELK